MWYVFDCTTPAKEAMFQNRLGSWSRCFSQTLIVHIIRTGRIPFVQSKPSLPLLSDDAGHLRNRRVSAVFAFWHARSSLVPLPWNTGLRLLRSSWTSNGADPAVKTWLNSTLRFDLTGPPEDFQGRLSDWMLQFPKVIEVGLLRGRGHSCTGGVDPLSERCAARTLGQCGSFVWRSTSRTFLLVSTIR